MLKYKGNRTEKSHARTTLIKFDFGEGEGILLFTMYVLFDWDGISVRFGAPKPGLNPGDMCR